MTVELLAEIGSVEVEDGIFNVVPFHQVSEIVMLDCPDLYPSADVFNSCSCIKYLKRHRPSVLNEGSLGTLTEEDRRRSEGHIDHE